MSTAVDELVAPDLGALVFERFRIVSRLRREARGDCYLAEPIEHGPNVEVRLLSHPSLRASADTLWRAVGRSLDLLATVDHPNVERVLRAGVVTFKRDPVVCVVAEVADGADLLSRLDERRRLPLPEALSIARQVVLGLIALHRKNVIHGDLRPANVVLGRAASGELGAVVLRDVAVNNLLLTPLRSSAALLEICAPDHLAPEQIEGDITTPATDMYGVGLLLHRMLSGRPAFQGDTAAEVLSAQLTEMPASLRELVGREVPTPVETLVLRCLAKRPEDRFESMQSLLTAIRQAEGATGAVPAVASVHPASIAPPRPTPAPSRPPPSVSGPISAGFDRAAVLDASASAHDHDSSAVVRGPSVREPRSGFTSTNLAGMPPPGRTAAYAIAVIRKEMVTSKQWFMAAAAMMLVAGIIGGYVIATVRNTHVPAPTLTASAPTALPTPRRPRRPHVRVVFRSNAQGAEVAIRGHNYPIPGLVELPAGDAPEMVEVTAEGFAARRLWMTLDSNTEETINLTPEAPSAPPPSAPDTLPTLTRDTVEHALEEHQGEVANCLNRAHARTPTLSGRFPVTIVIDPTGRVKRATWSGGDHRQMRALGCITGQIRRLTFPASNTGGDFVTVHTFDLAQQ